MRQPLELPLVCLVTDRRRLAGSGDEGIVRLARAAARAGANVVQIRESDLDDRTLAGLTRRVVDAVSDTPALVLVNERTDVALAAGAHGVHLRADSISARRVRAITPEGFAIGRSVHSAEEALREEEGADYLIMGTIYATPSKPPTAPLAGIEDLREVCARVRVPVLAIGGVTPDRFRPIAGAGASGLAAIRLFSDPMMTSSPDELEKTLTGLVAEIRDAWAHVTPLRAAGGRQA